MRENSSFASIIRYTFYDCRYKTYKEREVRRYTHSRPFLVLGNDELSFSIYSQPFDCTPEEVKNA
jgi:hypothetical protein